MKTLQTSGSGTNRSGGLRSLRASRRTRGVALIVVLSLVVIVSLILVAFVTTMMMDRTASASYGQSVAAEQIGQGAVNLVVAELRNEMGKDAVPDLTYSNRPLYTNVSSLNIQPQRVGTNSAMPNLIKTSTSSKPFTGTRADGTLVASGVSTFAPSTNGRFMDVNRWNAPYLGTFPNTASLPNWVIMTRSGATNTGTFGPTGNTLNNPAVDNKSYAIGRFAYAIYDVGGLLDITVAGHPVLTPEQINQVKGTLAGADLTAVGITDPDKFVKWRNAASAASTNAYFSYMTNYVSTNGFSKVAPGDTTFLGRQDLIKAAKLGVAGLSANVLTNLTTFTREKNSPSWGPRATTNNPTGNKIDYVTLSRNLSIANTNSMSTNFFVPYVRRTTPATIKTYQTDGVETDYQVVAGDPVVARRFPLDRIKWIGPRGPKDGGTDINIQACFGLHWDAPTGIWQYVGPTGTTEQFRIKTLAEVVSENREPNFFELLQAGILSGSLGMEAQITAATAAGATVDAAKVNFPYYTGHQASRTLNVFRVGAAILSQYEPTSGPVVVEYYGESSLPGKPIRWQATGIENLPYLNLFSFLAGQRPGSTTNLECFLLFGLWNPMQGPIPVDRPDIRMRVTGWVGLGNNYGRKTVGYTQTYFNIPEPYPAGFLYQFDKDANGSVGLSSSAVNGFSDPRALRAGDIVPSGDWTTSANTIGGISYAGYRLPDFVINPTDKPDAVIPTGTEEGAAEANGKATLNKWQQLYFGFNSNAADPFNFWLEYKNPDGVWVPYNYHAGINDPATWFTKEVHFNSQYMGIVQDGTPKMPVVAAPLQPMDPPAGLAIGYYVKQTVLISDPRALRFNPSTHQTTPSKALWSSYLNSSLWSVNTDPAAQTYGNKGTQNVQAYFGPHVGLYLAQGSQWNPATLSRNNTTPSGWGGVAATSYNTPTAAAYADPDGVQRVADSGLFTATPNNGNQWAGDPYALSTGPRVKRDRPIILNRPFYSVGELGYVSRDYPWKTLDFFTANSADGGLLDLFTVSQENAAFQKGKVSLNSSNPAVVESVLKSTFADVIGSTAISNPTKIAASLIALTSQSTGAVVGKDEIATKLVSNLTSSDFGGDDEEKIKGRREGVTRALADIGQSRTWNLLIDVVAQSGRYGPAASANDQFVVEGERRFWLHVAIDRFTGEIVDQQLEPVMQ